MSQVTSIQVILSIRGRLIIQVSLSIKMRSSLQVNIQVSLITGVFKDTG